MAEYVFESKPVVIEQQRSVFVRVALLGAALGLAAWVLTYLLERFVLSSLVCGGEVCAQGTVFAGNIAGVIIAIVGVVALVRMAVYRPLLIALGAVISLWGLAAWLGGLSILESVGWTVLLYALAYSAYTWIARIRNVPIMLILVTVLVIASRVIPLFV